jgi:hypothetical protein
VRAMADVAIGKITKSSATPLGNAAKR